MGSCKSALSEPFVLRWQSIRMLRGTFPPWLLLLKTQSRFSLCMETLHGSGREGVSDGVAEQAAAAPLHWLRLRVSHVRVSNK